MVKLSKYIADFLVANGIEHVFTVTGGGAMHLNDAFGHHPQLSCIYNHHEQACAIAAEAYARYSNHIAAVCVTSGPGGTNAITGVLGGWLDSIPMFIVSGQVKRETTTWSTDVPLRQLGDQEFNIVSSISSMTKYARMITDPQEIRYHLEKALYLAQNGRKGPVWLDIPLDVQAAQIDETSLVGFDPEELKGSEKPVYSEDITENILAHLRNAKRPVIFAGTAIRLANAYTEFLELIEKLQIPVVTAWNANDLLWDEHPLYCGRPGTVGTRGGNFVVQNCDLLLVLGSRLNIRLISYNYKNFARDAFKIIVDIDKNELKKPTVKPDLAIHADVKDVMCSIINSDYKPVDKHHVWLKWCRDINQQYPVVKQEYYNPISPMNPYPFLKILFEQFEEGETIICGNGSACVMTFQAGVIKRNQRMFTNSGCAAMGYGFPAAIGVCISKENARTICIDGDGSFQMNLQELQTVVYNHLNIKIIYLNNNGYHSIRQTQNNLFSPPLVGVCDGNGLSFPDAERLACAYQIPFYRISRLDEAAAMVQQILKTDGPVFCEVIVDPKQNFEPKLSSRVLPDGTMESPELDDMFPFLPKEEYQRIKQIKNS